MAVRGSGSSGLIATSVGVDGRGIAESGHCARRGRSGLAPSEIQLTQGPAALPGASLGSPLRVEYSKHADADVIVGQPLRAVRVDFGEHLVRLRVAMAFAK